MRLSCYLCLSFAYLSWGTQPAPPGELEHLPNAPKAGGKGESVAGSSSISRTSRNVLPGEPPWLPPSFFIHENSISLGAGCQRQPLKRGVLRPPLLRAGPHLSGQQRAVPGQFLTRVQGRWPYSARVHTSAEVPHRQTGWQPWPHIPEPEHTENQISHPPEVTCSHHCPRSGAVMPWDCIPKQTPVTLGKGAQAGTPLVLPALPHMERGAHSSVSQTLQRQLHTPPPLSQQEHKGRRGLLIPSCSAFPAICAALGIRKNLPFAVPADS